MMAAIPTLLQTSSMKEVREYTYTSLILCVHAMPYSKVHETTLTRTVVPHSSASISTPAPLSPLGSSGWAQRGQDLFSTDTLEYFGTALAMSKDGNILAAGGNGYSSPGHVQLFRLHTSSLEWDPLCQTLTGNFEDTGVFGTALALSADGTRVAVNAAVAGNQEPGRVRVFQLNRSTIRWVQLGETIPGTSANDRFGDALPLSADGSIVAVGGWKHADAGYVRIFRLDGGRDWQSMGQNLYGNATGSAFGWSVDLSSDGLTLAVGVPWGDDSLNGFDYAGQVIVFQYTGWRWALMGQVLYGKGSGEKFGHAVKVSGDGSVLAVGSDDDTNCSIFLCHVRVFGFNSLLQQWVQLGQDLGGIHLGSALALSLDGTILAAGGRNTTESERQVLVYQYSLENDRWNQVGGAITRREIRFGDSLAMNADGSVVVVASPDDSGPIRTYVRI